MRLEDRALQMQGKGFFLLDSCFSELQIQQDTLHYTLGWFGIFSFVNTRPYFIEAELCQLSELPNIERSVYRRQDGAWSIMEVFSGFFCFSWLIGEVADLLFQYQLKITKAGWAGYFFLAGIQEKVRMIRCNFSCNWAGTIWIRIWKGLNKQMVDVIYSNSFFWGHLYILKLSSKVQLFLSWRLCKLVDPKEAPAEVGTVFPQGWLLFGDDGWILIFGAKVETETFSKAWYQHKEELQQGREQASDFMLPLHRTLSIFFGQLILDRSEANLATRSFSKCWTLACRRVL